tara:strand:+ start:7123 stop:8883 length:1761 start_codon:yes stop_codon:yes gene_type:complete
LLLKKDIVPVVPPNVMSLDDRSKSIDWNNNDDIQQLIIKFIWSDYIKLLNQWESELDDILDTDFFTLRKNSELTKEQLIEAHAQFVKNLEWIFTKKMSFLKKKLDTTKDTDMLPIVDKKAIFSFTKEERILAGSTVKMEQLQDKINELSPTDEEMEINEAEIKELNKELNNAKENYENAKGKKETTLAMNLTLEEIFNKEIANLVQQGQWTPMGEKYISGETRPTKTEEKDGMGGNIYKIPNPNDGENSPKLNTRLLDFKIVKDKGDGSASIKFSDMDYKLNNFELMKMKPIRTQRVVEKAGKNTMKNSFWENINVDFDREKLLEEVMKMPEISNPRNGYKYKITLPPVTNTKVTHSVKSRFSAGEAQEGRLMKYLFDNEYKHLPYLGGTQFDDNAQIGDKITFRKQRFTITGKSKEEIQGTTIRFLELDKPYFISIELREENKQKKLYLATDGQKGKERTSFGDKSIFNGYLGKTIQLDTSHYNKASKDAVAENFPTPTIEITKQAEYTPTHFTRPRTPSGSTNLIPSNPVTAKITESYFVPLGPTQRPNAVTAATAYFNSIKHNYTELKLAIANWKQDIEQESN